MTFGMEYCIKQLYGVVVILATRFTSVISALKQAINSRGLAAFFLLFAIGVLTPNTAKAANCYFYNVTIQGVVTLGDAIATSAAQQFSINQSAMWRDAGYDATHPVELWLSTFQDINASTNVGQIELMTNSAFAANAGIASARFDLASVAPSSDGISFQIDPAMSFQLPSPNVFIAPGIGSMPGGLGGLGFLPGAGGSLGSILNGSPILSVSYFVPRQGGGSFATSSDGTTISGQLDMLGTSLDNTSFQGQYQANFAGQFTGAQAC